MKNLLDGRNTLQHVLDWFNNESNSLIDEDDRQAATAYLSSLLHKIKNINFTFKLNNWIYFCDCSLTNDSKRIGGYIEPVTYSGWHLESVREYGYIDFDTVKGKVWLIVDEKPFYLCEMNDVEFLYNRDII